MAEHKSAAFELILLIETAWCCLHWRQLSVYVYAFLSVCVCGFRVAELTVPFCKARAVTVCMCSCQHDGGEGSYSDLMNPSAFKRHSSSRMQAGANEQRPGSPSSGQGVDQTQYFQSRLARTKTHKY